MEAGWSIEYIGGLYFEQIFSAAFLILESRGMVKEEHETTQAEIDRSLKEAQDMGVLEIK